MDFQEFLHFVPKLITAELPAVEAHVKMAPLERLANLDNQSIENNNPRTAAVLMLCYPKNGETHLVLIVRNSYKGVHSAQIAFPGGKFEQEIRILLLLRFGKLMKRLGFILIKLRL
jgi:hypothetical protein